MLCQYEEGRRKVRQVGTRTKDSKQKMRGCLVCAKVYQQPVGQLFLMSACQEQFPFCQLLHSSIKGRRRNISFIQRSGLIEQSVLAE